MSETPQDVTAKRRKISWGQVLVRLFLVLLIGTAVGAGIFYGVSYLANNYFQVVQSNIDNINMMATQMEQLDTQINARLDDLVTRLDTLEVQSDARKLTLAELQTSITELETNSADMKDRMDIQETNTADLADSLSAQDVVTTTLKTQMADLDENLSDAQANLDELTVQISSMTAVLDEWNLSTSSYDITMNQFKALVLLSRAQLYISQNNFGLARQDVASTYEVIANLETNTQPNTAQEYTAILTRLDSAMLNLPDTPITANADIESAWNNLWAMIETELQVQPESEMTPEPTEEP